MPRLRHLFTFKLLRKIFHYDRIKEVNSTTRRKKEVREELGEWHLRYL